MANLWFRLYSEIINDPKVMILPESLRWRYVALLCLQCNGTLEDAPDDEIALSLRVTLDEWIETMEAFKKRRLLDADGKLSAWEKRQYISDLKDPTAAERQKRYRDNKRNNRNATVTSRLPEADTDTDITPTPSGVVPFPKKSAKKTFRQWLDEIKSANQKAISDYEPVWKYARDVGIPDDWITIAWMKFIDRYRDCPDSSGKRYQDWRRVFLNSVKGNWFKLWYAKDGVFALTTIGQQADLETREAHG